MSNTIMSWFNKNLNSNPVDALEYAYFAPIRFEVYKNFKQLPFDHELIINSEEAVKKSIRRVNLLLALERVLYHLTNNLVEEDETERMILKVASILRELKFYMCSRKLNSIQASMVYLVKIQKEDGSFPVSFEGNVFILETLLMYNMGKNIHVHKGMRWLMRQHNKDYGWGYTESGKSDIWLSLSVLRAFTLFPQYTTHTMILKGAEFVLNNLYSENLGGVLEGKGQWMQFSSGYMIEDAFKGGIVKVLEVMARLNYSSDDPCIDALLKKLISLQMHSGQWPDQAYRIEDAKSDERVSIVVVRILHLFYIIPERGKGTIRKYKMK